MTDYKFSFIITESLTSEEIEEQNLAEHCSPEVFAMILERAGTFNQDSEFYLTTPQANPPEDQTPIMVNNP